jgi:hypothetical protein
MKPCTEEVHKINPKLVIFLSGLGFDTDLGPVTSGGSFANGKTFRIADLPEKKIALELHNYSNLKNCTAIQAAMERQGWNALNSGNSLVLPVVMTEFGFKQAGTDYRNVYAQCMKDYFISRRAGWFYWALPGSYYLRQGKADFDETWGLFNHDWTDWRNPAAVRDYFRPMIKGTLAG